MRINRYWAGRPIPADHSGLYPQMRVPPGALRLSDGRKSRPGSDPREADRKVMPSATTVLKATRPHPAEASAPRGWTFLTNHAQVLLAVAQNPDLRVRE